MGFGLGFCQPWFYLGEVIMLEIGLGWFRRICGNEIVLFGEEEVDGWADAWTWGL